MPPAPHALPPAAAPSVAMSLFLNSTRMRSNSHPGGGPFGSSSPETTMNASRPSVEFSYHLRFCSLFNPGRALAFPCDQAGHVDLNALSEASRRNYFYARAMLGREFAFPAVSAVPVTAH